MRLLNRALRPQVCQGLPYCAKLGLYLSWQGCHSTWLLLLARNHLLGLLERAERRFPARFQLCRHQPVIWVDTCELSLRQLCFITQPSQLLLLCVVYTHVDVLLSADCFRVGVQFDWR